MANLSRIILIGRLTADPEARFTVNGTPMTKFRLAVDRFQKEGTPKSADFIDIVAWTKLAEICAQYLKKERLVLIEGRIQIRSFNDESGQRKWVTEVIARNMQMLDKESKTAAVNEAVPVSNNVADENEVTEPEDDLPF